MYLIRNYGSSRKLPYKDKGIFVGADSILKTENGDIAKAMAVFPQIHVVERQTKKGEVECQIPMIEPISPDEVEVAPDGETVTKTSKSGVFDTADEPGTSKLGKSKTPNYDKMTRPALFKQAKILGIKTSKGMTKKRLVKMLKDG